LLSADNLIGDDRLIGIDQTDPSRHPPSHSSAMGPVKRVTGIDRSILRPR
jgi:hypothetical protein